MRKIHKPTISAIVISFIFICGMSYSYAKNSHTQSVVSSSEIAKDEEIKILKSKIVSLEQDLKDLKKAKPKIRTVAVDLSHLRTVIKGTLKYMGIYSKDLEEQLIFTVSVESDAGRLLFQKGGGPALGAFQILPSTEKDILNRWLKLPKNNSLREKVMALRSNSHVVGIPQLMTDYRYQVAIAACVYLKTGKKVPSHKDVVAMSRFYKRYYNTNEPEKIAVSLKRYKRILAENDR